jgi:hypothetical protein
MQLPETPELDKISSVVAESEPIGAFLEWLFSKYTLCSWDEDGEHYYPSHRGTTSLLSEYFEIDENKAEKERRALLEAIRNQS